MASALITAPPGRMPGSRGDGHAARSTGKNVARIAHRAADTMANDRIPASDNIPTETETAMPVHQGYGSGRRASRSAALTLTLAIHASALALGLASWGYEEMNAAPASQTLVAFDVGTAKTEAPSPPDPVETEQPDHAEIVPPKEAVAPAEQHHATPEAKAQPLAKVGSLAASKPAETGPVGQKPTKISTSQSNPTPKAEAAPTAPATPTVSKAQSDAYGSKIMTHLHRHVRPNTVGAGVTVVRFTITPDGGVTAISIASGSGSKRFDREAIDMIRRAAPFPKPPPGVNRDFSFRVTGQ